MHTSDLVSDLQTFAAWCDAQESFGCLSELDAYADWFVVPVLDDSDFSGREQQAADETWRDCYHPFERIAYIREHRSQFEFSSWADMLGCVRGNYFVGYASELLS